MSSMKRAGAQNKSHTTKDPKTLKDDEKEYKQVKYSLKMAMRMINGKFEDLKIEQYN